MCKFSVLSNIAKLFSVVSDAVLSFYKLEKQVKNIILQKKTWIVQKNWIENSLFKYWTIQLVIVQQI